MKIIKVVKSDTQNLGQITYEEVRKKVENALKRIGLPEHRRVNIHRGYEQGYGWEIEIESTGPADKFAKKIEESLRKEFPDIDWTRRKTYSIVWWTSGVANENH